MDTWSWGTHLLALSFWPFIQFMMFSRQVYCGGLPFPPPVDHVLSELSAMTRPSWLALHCMAHGFIELTSPFAMTRWGWFIPVPKKGGTSSQEGWYHFPRKVKVKVAQSCSTLCNPMDYIVLGILQARILEWVAFLFSRGSSQSSN